MLLCQYLVIKSKSKKNWHEAQVMEMNQSDCSTIWLNYKLEQFTETNISYQFLRPSMVKTLIVITDVMTQCGRW